MASPGRIDPPPMALICPAFEGIRNVAENTPSLTLLTETDPNASHWVGMADGRRSTIPHRRVSCWPEPDRQSSPEMVTTVPTGPAREEILRCLIRPTHEVLVARLSITGVGTCPPGSEDRCAGGGDPEQATTITAIAAAASLHVRSDIDVAHRMRMRGSGEVGPATGAQVDSGAKWSVPMYVRANRLA